MNLQKLGLFTAITIAACSLASAAPFELSDLPYGYDALEPLLSEKTLRTHHTKHHAKYINTANHFIEIGDSTLKDLSMEELITTQTGALFNNVAQAWNHKFYWHSMKPGGGGTPKRQLADAIVNDFGSVKDMINEIEDAAITVFGSGWAWLSYDKKEKKLVVSKTSGAGNPMTDGLVPLLTIDVWEHAYYLDYQEKRPTYVRAFFDNLVNWEFAEVNLMIANQAVGTDEL